MNSAASASASKKYASTGTAPLGTDSVVVSDTIWIAAGRPAIAYGLRGLMGFTVALTTGGLLTIGTSAGEKITATNVTLNSSGGVTEFATGITGNPGGILFNPIDGKFYFDEQFQDTIGVFNPNTGVATVLARVWRSCLPCAALRQKAHV